MAPSGGVSCSPLRSIFGAFAKPPASFSSFTPLMMRRTLSLSSWSERLADPTNKVQSYVSRSNDPYVNLSIEEHILRTSPPDSHVLFLYVNRPCIVIGRNQNPWLEVNLALLDGKTQQQQQQTDTTAPAIGNVDLVRRRSGGGAVFHDGGNLNWSVVCPRDAFTRDKHAEMVVRALRHMGIQRARVNERHDIVLDQGSVSVDSDPKDLHSTPYTMHDQASSSDSGPRALKVSGSAYKIISARTLHHATLLLSSPNVRHISKYLRSPAKSHITAKGVPSVSTPVTNIGVDMERFKETLQREFGAAYGAMDVQMVGEELLENEAIKKGYDELRTNEWMWLQTPEFTISLQPARMIEISMIVRHGVIHEIRGHHDMFRTIQRALVGRKLHEIRDWAEFLKQYLVRWGESEDALARELQKHLPVPKFHDT